VKVLVIGFGSIGQRHTRILKELGCQVGVLSRRNIDFVPHFPDLKIALRDYQPEYVVVANRTNEHLQTLEDLIANGFSGHLMVEKPLFHELSKIPSNAFNRTAVAYNLRSHILLKKLKEFLKNAGQLITANIYVGSYLPNWRVNTDYTQSYSAKKSQGGGVLRDLSHELDYAFWLFGSWRRLTASGGTLSDLEIDSGDAYTVLMETKHCPLVSIHMNYLDRTPRREILVNTQKHTIRVDLVRNIIAIDGVEELISVSTDDSYRSQHQTMLTGNIEELCSLEEAFDTLLTIEAVEKAALSHKWIER
jgi:predicted dehydrogenase